MKLPSMPTLYCSCTLSSLRQIYQSVQCTRGSVSLTFHSALRKLSTEPSMVLPAKFRFIQQNGFREEYFFRNRPIRNKNCLQWPCLLTDQNGMSNSYRGPDTFYHVSVHLAKLFQSRRFLEINQSGTRIACGGHVFNGSGQNEQSLQRTFHRYFLPSFGSFGKAVSEEKIFQKSTNQKQELSVAAMFVNGSELNEQYLQRTFHGCFLPTFGSFGDAVSEEKIFLEIDQTETRIAYGGHVCQRIRTK